MSHGDRFLDDIADAVLDGEPVDWASAESSAQADAKPFLPHLRLVAAVADAQRNVLPGVPPVATPPWALGHWGHLRLIEPIGRGTFGDVFRAWDTRLDREVALKLLPASSSARDHDTSIIHEGRLLAKVRHPNVVTIYGAEQIGDRVGLWMELVRGRTLEQALTAGATHARDVVHVGIELCHAVSAVHAAGLLHRDIKAHNVMRADDGRIVLMDFGAGADRAERDAPAVAAGTPLYLAPELYPAEAGLPNDGQPATVRSDLYSLGVLLYHLASGAYPFRGQSIQEVRLAHERGERSALSSVRPGLPADLVRVIERACDPNPSRRYESADALARDLAALKPRPVAVRVGRALAAGAAVLLVVLLLSEGWLRMQGQPGVAARLRGALAAMLAAPANPVILVRPLTNLGEPSGEPLVDTISNNLIRQLGIIDGVQVKSQDSSFMLKDEKADSVAIGKRLGANLVVEGDARVSGDRLVVRAALISVASGRALWSEPIERVVSREGDVVALVDDLTRSIVDRLRLKLGRTQRRYETDLATYGMYRRAQALRGARDYQAAKAVALYREVIAADPAYAPAMAALAATYGYLGLFYPDVNNTFIRPQEAIVLLEPWARQALALDGFLADAHAAMGFVHALSLRWSEADSSFRRAIGLEPTRSTLYSDYVLAVLVPSGRLDEAMRLLETALERDPLSLDLRRVLTRVQLNAGRFDEALKNAQRVIERDPTFPNIHQFAAWARFFRGERVEAIRWFEQFAAGDDRKAGTADDRVGIVGYLHAIYGRRAEAEAIAALPQFAQLPQRQAEIYGLLGDRARALRALERLADLNPVRAAYQLTLPEVGLSLDDPAVSAFRRARLGFRD
jgi:TolB-like protein/Tfp pilus assembly protein PilF